MHKQGEKSLFFFFSLKQILFKLISKQLPLATTILLPVLCNLLL